MDDWRIYEEEFFENLELFEIRFPDYWKKSYSEKNDFYRMIEQEAIDFVKQYGRGKEFLEGEKIQEFWHRHCDLCTETITTKDVRVCYCTNDYFIWICEGCFKDFCERFQWKIIK